MFQGLHCIDPLVALLLQYVPGKQPNVLHKHLPVACTKKKKSYSAFDTSAKRGKKKGTKGVARTDAVALGETPYTSTSS